jgi:cell division protein FtsZ
MITKGGVISIDFNDVKSVMSGQGDVLMGIGVGHGENRAVEAVKNATDAKLLENVSIEGSQALLINVVGGPDMGATEVQEINTAITSLADPSANVISGFRIDDDLDDEIHVTIVATQRPQEKKQEPEPSTEKKPDVISLSVWDKRNYGPHSARHGEPRRTADLFEDGNLKIPTVLRINKYSDENRT